MKGMQQNALWDEGPKRGWRKGALRYVYQAPLFHLRTDLPCLLTTAITITDPVLLKRKATKLRKETGDDRYFAPIEKSTKSIPKTVAWALLRPFQLLFLEPMCLVLDVYSAVLLGVLYLFFGAFPLVFGTNYGFNLWQIGLTFMGLLVAMVLAACSTPVWGTIRDRLAVRRGLRENAESGGQPKEEPEDQLPSVIVGAPLITSGLFIFGFTTYPWVHWIFPVIGSAIFGVG